MARNNKPKQYPVVKYRIITGDGYHLTDEEHLIETLQKNIDFANSRNEQSRNRFMPKHVIKVTEEFIPLDKLIK